VSETWLDDSITDSEIALPGYSIERKDRQSLGGGVCLYINNSISYNSRLDLDNDIEAIWIDILIKKTKPILLGCVYRPPKQIDFVDRIQYMLSTNVLDQETIILGDTNINLGVQNNSSKMVQMYCSFLN